MTDAESLLLVVGILYFIECLVWVPVGATAFVNRWGRAWYWTTPERLWGNDRGGLLLLNPLPAYGTVMVCRETTPDKPVGTASLGERLNQHASAVAWLRRWETALFVHLFGSGGFLVWGTESLWALPLFLLGLIGFGVIIGVIFWRTHRRLYPTRGGERWQRLLILALCPPAACRAHDVLEHRLFEDVDPLVVAQQLCPETAFRDFARRYLYDRQRTNELPELWLPPAADDGARAFCPRCHAVYLGVEGNCRDCRDVPLRILP